MNMWHSYARTDFASLWSNLSIYTQNFSAAKVLPEIRVALVYFGSFFSS